jgi:hypothetical protein
MSEEHMKVNIYSELKCAIFMEYTTFRGEFNGAKISRFLLFCNNILLFNIRKKNKYKTTLLKSLLKNTIENPRKITSLRSK